MTFKCFSSLPKEAIDIRKSVFMKEQGFYSEFDEIDNNAVHIVMYNENDKPIAVCRLFEGKEKGVFILGRLAVIKEYRGKNIGLKLVKETEKIAAEKGGKTVVLHAQCAARGFYEKIGYHITGSPDTEDEGCPHIWMVKDIRKFD